MMTFNTLISSDNGATLNAPDAATGKPGESPADGFAAALAATWMMPQSSNCSEKAEKPADKHDADDPSSTAQTGDTTNVATTTSFTINPFVSPTNSPDCITPPLQKADSEPVSATMISITNLFKGNPCSRTGAETADAAFGRSTGQTDAQGANSDKTGTITDASSPVASIPAQSSEPASVALSSLAKATLDLTQQTNQAGSPDVAATRPAPDTPPASLFQMPGAMKRFTISNVRVSTAASTDKTGALMASLKDLLNRHNLTESPAAKQGLPDWRKGLESSDEPGQNKTEKLASAALNQTEKISNAPADSSEKTGKASLLETAFREVARAAADPQPQVSSVKDALAASSHHAASSDDDGNITETTKQPETGSTATLSASNANSASQTAASGADSAATGIARQVLSPMLELARNMQQRETRSLRLQLRPEKFGQIDLQITRGSDGRLSAQLAADLRITQHALAEGIHQLRESLEQSGLSVDRLEVNLTLDLQGKAGNSTPQEGEAFAATSNDARRFVSEATDEPATNTGDEQQRLLNLRI